MVDRRVVRRYAGMMAMVLLLGGCGSSGGAGQAETSGMPSQEETVVQTEASSEAAAEKTTEATATAEETAETSMTEKETTEAAAETTAEESPETAEAAEETTEAASEAEETTEAAAETVQTTETETAAGTETTAAETVPAAAGAASLSDIYSRIEQQVSLNSPMTVPAEFIANYFGIDVSASEDYLFVMSEMATSAETIVIVKAGGADKQALADSLQTVINQKAAEMENYLPDQYDIVSRSTVHQTGDYVWMVISENAGAIESIIEAGLQ